MESTLHFPIAKLRYLSPKRKKMRAKSLFVGAGQSTIGRNDQWRFGEILLREAANESGSRIG